MLRGLPGIRHKVSSVSLHHLGDIFALGMHSRGPSIFGIGPPTPSSGSTPSSHASCPCVVHLAYLDEMQQCKCMNAKNGN